MLILCDLVYHLMMSIRRKEGSPREAVAATISRRQLLVGSGVVALGSLSGCLGTVASVVTNTGASPAATFAGVGQRADGRVAPGDPVVERLTPNISADSGLLSGEVELEAWVTAVTSRVQNHNSSRSNRTQPASFVGSDSGGSDGPESSTEAIYTALDLETTLLGQTEAASGSISKRSARTGRNHISDMEDTITEIQATLRDCPDDVCTTVLEHSDARMALTRQALADVDSGEWDSAAAAVREVQGIVEGDIERLETATNPLSEASETEGESTLYEYLAGNPVVGERFAVTLPDAVLPDGNGSLADEVTPQRFIDYLTGHLDDAGGERTVVYSWGKRSGGDADGRCEDVAMDGKTLSVCPSPHLDASLSRPVDTGGVLEMSRADGHVTVLNTPPTTVHQEGRATPSVLAVPADGAAYEPKNLNEWGTEEGEKSWTPTLVAQVMVQPADCPEPFPALLYVRRCRNDDQLVYTGGWVVDDAALYENSVTLLTAEAPSSVIGIGVGDLDGDGYGDLVSRSLTTDRARNGSRMVVGPVGELIDSGVVSASVLAHGNDRVVRKKPGRTTESPGDETGGTVVVHVPLDAPILHLVDAGRASNEVKFKAGAELSKSVN